MLFYFIQIIGFIQIPNSKCKSIVMLALANITNKKLIKVIHCWHHLFMVNMCVGYGVIVGLITEMSLISFWTQNSL